MIALLAGIYEGDGPPVAGSEVGDYRPVGIMKLFLLAQQEWDTTYQALNVIPRALILSSDTNLSSLEIIRDYAGLGHLAGLK